MKKTIYIVSFLCVLVTNAQSALYNSGNIRIHKNGQLGFHTDLINDAAFDENLGLAGFYSDAPLAVSGAFVPTFYDLEILNEAGTTLLTGINVENNVNFVEGDFFTIRTTPENSLNFLQNAFYNGDSNGAKVNGYVSITNQQNFTFPTGDLEELRPLIFSSNAVNDQASCAYFRENPSNPDSFDRSFDSEQRKFDIDAVSFREFWRLTGTIPSTISISWNERSDIEALSDDVATIIPIGWSKAENQWVNLGVTASAGDLSQGFVSSASFIPNDYEILTFGNFDPNGMPDEPGIRLTLDNYLLTPNGDGANDFLRIPELEQSPNNTVRIYNRFGSKVFEMNNYTNEFIGIANTKNFVLKQDKGLPIGVYFYTVTMNDTGLKFQGFLYLAR